MKTNRKGYTQRIDNEGWTEQSKVPFKLACCDCGLIHTMVLVAGKKGSPIGIAAARDNRATGQRRRHMKKKAKSL